MDVNNDGHVEVVVAVSYYFDKEEYSNKELDFDPSMYVAGGLALWDLQVRLYYVLFYFILFYSILFCFISFHFISFYFILFYFILFYFILFYFI